jgi:hypothetical protein
MELLVILGVISVAVLAIAKDAKAKSNEASNLAAEIAEPQSVEYYEELTSRARALKRTLDAETELAESYINTMRTRGLLDELPEMLDHDRAKRTAKK